MNLYWALAGVLSLLWSCEMDWRGSDDDKEVSVTAALPTLVLPPNAWLVFESVSAAGPDRSSNWRFFLANDGCYYVTGNQSLQVDVGQRHQTDPALFWNKDWPEASTYCLDEAEQKALDASIDELGVFSGTNAYGRPDSVRVNDGTIERWTLVKSEGQRSVVIEDRNYARRQPASGRDSEWARRSLQVDALERMLDDAAKIAMKRQAGKP